MLTQVRWQRERELMHSVLPEFKPFNRGSVFGFEGYVRGHKSGTSYHVVLEADQATYPQYPPSVYMKPRIGPHWIGGGDGRRLCMEREWRPARSTFANSLLAVIRYVDEHDPDGGSVAPPEEAELPPGEGDATPAQMGRGIWLFFGWPNHRPF